MITAKRFFGRFLDLLMEMPVNAWVLLGFSIPFLFFFIGPVFFDPSRDMQFIPYISTLSPIGQDFRSIVSSTSTWITSGAVPATLYPPVTLIFFAPLTFLSYEMGYKVFLFITLVCFILITWILPQWINKQKIKPAFAVLVFITGIVSYGLQFELERGQWNVIAFTFCLAAIHVFHEHPKRRWLAYLLFTISVQLKLYPAIFVVALIEDWSDWKNNPKRIIGLGIVNILALFLFGLGPMLTTFGFFGRAQANQVGRPYNLSIRSFGTDILSLLPHEGVYLWIQGNNWIFQLLLLVFFMVCFAIIVWQPIKRGSKGFDPWVFMACTIGAFIIPPLSFDYKLSILPAAIAVSIPYILFIKDGPKKPLVAFLAFVFSVAYSSTLYSYKIKPEIIRNSFPALLVILTIVTICSWYRLDADAVSLSDSPEAQFKEP